MTNEQFDFGPADQEAIERREAARRGEEYMRFKMNEIRNIPVNEHTERPTAEAILAIEQAIREAAPGEIVEVPNEYIDVILAERNAIHGDFTNDAEIAQALKDVMRRGLNWSILTPVQREALEQTQTKIARILAGDPNHPDHWKDLQGYPRLVEQRLAR